MKTLSTPGNIRILLKAGRIMAALVLDQLPEVGDHVIATEETLRETVTWPRILWLKDREFMIKSVEGPHPEHGYYTCSFKKVGTL